MERPAVAGDARTSIWRAAVLFRVASAMYCVVVILHLRATYAHPGLALAVAALIVIWSAITSWYTLDVGRPGWRFVVLDFFCSATLTLSTMPVQTYHQSHGGVVTLTSVWVTSPVIGAAITGGWRWGAWTGAVTGAVSVVVRQGYDGRTWVNIFLLITAGAVLGYVVELVVKAQSEVVAANQRQAVALAEQAALAERVRLGRSIHDGVLQVLALVQRYGSENGGEAARLGHLAAEQEEALRALVTGDARTAGGVAPFTGTAGVAELDLAAALVQRRSHLVTVSVPAQPVMLAAPVVTELLGAVGEALANVAWHAGEGAHTWVLLEDDPEAGVVLTVRDDGCGIESGRLAQAQAAGRMGVAGSILGRVEELGGQVRIDSAPGKGTEIELRLPMPVESPVSASEMIE